MSDQPVVIITGAGSGIGAAAVQRFYDDGYAVVLSGRTEQKLVDTAEAVGSQQDARLLVCSADVTSEQDVDRLIEQTLKYFGRIDTLVNNAGVCVGGEIDSLSVDDWDKQQRINGRSMFLTIKKSLPYLKKTKGSVINVSSVSGLGGDWGMFAYNASKGMVSNLTRALALDFGASGVRVSAVAPSLTRTPMAQGIFDDEQNYDQFKTRIPMQRGAEPEEVADVIAFLASSDARFVSGVVLPVDGGLSASNGQPNMNG